MLAAQIQLPEISAGTTIPKKLHQICLPNARNLPDKIRQNIDALQERNPGWAYTLYDDAMAETFIQRTYGDEMLALYRRIDPAYRSVQSDVLRNLICYAKGGVYLDLKSTAIRPLDEIIRPEDVFLLSQWKVHRALPAGEGPHPELRHIPGHEYCNWAIFSAPGHPFLRAVIERFMRNIQNYGIFNHGVGHMGALRVAGPIAYSLAIHPLRPQNPHRYVNFEDEEGVLFSIFGDVSSHRNTIGRHYSELSHPIIQGSYTEKILANIIHGHVMPQLSYFKGFVRRRLRI